MTTQARGDSSGHHVTGFQKTSRTCLELDINNMLVFRSLVIKVLAWAVSEWSGRSVLPDRASAAASATRRYCNAPDRWSAPQRFPTLQLLLSAFCSTTRPCKCHPLELQLSHCCLVCRAFPPPRDATAVSLGSVSERGEEVVTALSLGECWKD